MTSPVFIYGAGGHARELAWLIKSSKNAQFDILGFIDDQMLQASNAQNAGHVMSFSAARAISDEAGIIIGIGDSKARRHIAGRLASNNIHSPKLIHSSVDVADSVSLGTGCVICGGSLLTVDIKICDHVHINIGCTISHDVVIGEFTTLSPRVSIAGNVMIGSDVFIGIGASIINGCPERPLVIGNGAVIAAGACVTQSAGPNTLIAGVPAVVKKSW